MQTELFFAFKLVFALQSEEIESAFLGMSLTTLREVPRSVFRFSRVAVARISDQLIFQLRSEKLTVDQEGGSV